MAQYQLKALLTFYGLHLHLAERCSENLQSARGPARCKSGPAITWLVAGCRTVSNNGSGSGLAEVESRTQGSRPRPRPRTQKKSEAKAKAKDSLSEDRHSRGQGQECSRPRPRTKDTKRKCSPKKKKKKVFTKIFQAISKKKKVFTKIFQAVSTKKRFPKNFSTAPQNFNFPKNSAVLEPRTGQFSRT